MILALLRFFVTLMLAHCRAQILNEDFPGDLYSSLSDELYPSNAVLEPIYEPNVMTMKHRSGSDVILHCRCQNERKVSWDFQPCQHDSNGNSCENYYAKSSWKTLDFRHRSRKCRLELRNLNETNSGLYRCTENNATLKMFELDVEGPVKYDGPRPQLLSIHPTNATIPQNAHLIIQCKVSSASPPSIWWFKETGDKKVGIKYFDKYYYRINTSDQLYPVPGEINVYLSKLNIYNARDTDTGDYACAAVSTSGLDYRIATVKVVSGTVYWEPHTPFSLLFLIPLAFALVPVTVWLCYYRKKKNQRREIEMPQQEKRLIRPVLNNNELARVPVV